MHVHLVATLIRGFDRQHLPREDMYGLGWHFQYVHRIDRPHFTD
jgi:hypothetical protein